MLFCASVFEQIPTLLVKLTFFELQFLKSEVLSLFSEVQLLMVKDLSVQICCDVVAFLVVLRIMSIPALKSNLVDGFELLQSASTRIELDLQLFYFIIKALNLLLLILIGVYLLGKR